jgi:ADP-heptose:LPS heptosyltransferase
MLRIRREKFDCLVDMICDDSVTALFMSQYLAPGKPRIGIGKKKFKQYYDFNYDHRMNNTGHIIDNTLKLLTAFGIDVSRVSGFAPPYLSDEVKKKSAEFFKELENSEPSSLKVGINLSAGAPSRVWQPDKSVELMRRILETYPEARIILFTIPNERRKGADIISHFENRVNLIPAGLNLMGVSAIIANLEVLITPDTSLVHIARAFNVQVVGLYTRFMKNFLLWKPFGQENGSVVAGNDYNIHDITVEAVFNEFMKVTDAKQAVGR